MPRLCHAANLSICRGTLTPHVTTQDDLHKRALDDGSKEGHRLRAFILFYFILFYLFPPPYRPPSISLYVPHRLGSFTKFHPPVPGIGLAKEPRRRRWPRQ